MVQFASVERTASFVSGKNVAYHVGAWSRNKTTLHTSLCPSFSPSRSLNVVVCICFGIVEYISMSIPKYCKTNVSIILRSRRYRTC